MKHIKVFESFTKNDELSNKISSTLNGRLCWRVNTERPYFQASLLKLGMPLYMCEKFNGIFDKIKNWDILIFYDNREGHDGTDKEYLCWSWQDANLGISFDDHFLGEIEATEEDVERYEMELNAQKYNL